VSNHAPISIVPPRSEDLPTVAALFREYADGIAVDLSYQGFEDELASLPGAYAPPRGTLLIAWEGDVAIGCVAVRPLAEQDICEMKRLHVRAAAQGRGIGRRLASAAIAHARRSGFKAMRLDTLSDMKAAQNLYRSLGFVTVSPYYPTPIAGTVFMELTLGAPPP
jgi:ribosomal protein S18 acetylase RimI-like enzyme